MIRDFSTLVNESSCWKPIRSWTAENKSRRCHLLKEKGQQRYIAAAAAASTSNRITGKTYALSFQLRSLFKACIKAVFREPALGDIIIFPFIGEENPKLAAKWIASFVKWALSEKLNAEQQHLCASAALFGSASDWCMKMHLEQATWEEFYFLFREKYVNKILEWPGSHLYPYFLYCNGEIKNDGTGQAAIQAVLTTPSLEHDFGHLSRRLDFEDRFKILVEFEALSEGLRVALDNGVKHILAWGNSRKVHERVRKRAWSSAHRALHEALLKLQALVNQFETFEVRYCDSEQNHLVAEVAHQTITSILDGKEAVCLYRQFKFHQPQSPEKSKTTCQQQDLVAADTWDTEEIPGRPQTNRQRSHQCGLIHR